MNIFEEERNRRSTSGIRTFEDGWPDQLSPLPLPAFNLEQTPSQMNIRRISKWSSTEEQVPFADSPIDEMITWILPVVQVEQRKNGTSRLATILGTNGAHVESLRSFAKSAGLYALASVALPLVALLLTPFLTRNLSSSDYGVLTILNTFVGLIAGVSQLGLASSFFRAYGYDYMDARDKRDVLATVTLLLFFSSMLIAVGMTLLAPLLAHLLLGRASYSNYFSITGWIVLLQNLTVPGYAWLRAENRALRYSLLSITSLLTTLIATIILVGQLHWGITGALFATGSGYAVVLICTIPVVLLHAGIKIRRDITHNLMTFGLPLVLSFVSYWVLQLSDRYLLTLLGSLEQTAKYAVVYTLGSAISVVVIGPFTLAWPSAMFTIAKRDDAAHAFQLFFRWFGLLLLLAAFGLSLTGTFVLNWLFPVAYHASAPIIPIVAVSIAFYGLYYIFMVGANIQRKTWVAPVLTTFVAIVNIVCNLALIPAYGAIGAALATLIAYAALTIFAYVINQRIYPIPFEIDIFVAALLLGVALYKGSDYLTQTLSLYYAWSIRISICCLYGVSLILLGKFWPSRSSYKHIVS